MVRLSAENLRILSMARRGVSEREMARILGLSHGAVQRRIRSLRKAAHDVPAHGRIDPVVLLNDLPPVVAPDGAYLPDHLRQALALKQAGLATREIADRVGLHSGIVAEYLRRARRRIEAVARP